MKCQYNEEEGGAALCFLLRKRELDRIACSKGFFPLPSSVPPFDPQGRLRLSTGGAYRAKYAMRFAAGFGSQVAFALYASVDAVPSAVA